MQTRRERWKNRQREGRREAQIESSDFLALLLQREKSLALGRRTKAVMDDIEKVPKQGESRAQTKGVVVRHEDQMRGTDDGVERG